MKYDVRRFYFFGYGALHLGPEDKYKIRGRDMGEKSAMKILIFCASFFLFLCFASSTPRVSHDAIKKHPKKMKRNWRLKPCEIIILP